MFEVLSVGVGGFVGAALRYLISSGIARFMNSRLPLGTLCVNVFGGLLMGFIMQWSLQSAGLSPRMRLFLTTGLLGGFTTFSTFSYETMNLILSLAGVIAGQLLAKAVLAS
ncbi:fluoride efflux transporter CrcB [Eubacterium maltosivorans]|uniref:fluoride efflux transporter CrcB n=1 Tax=Eubacterium maltosivorans TaxID=2041044 RepID=UPI0018A0469C|nr:fluoride efflux transporter CrcB [Eubacterium maltosivorans]